MKTKLLIIQQYFGLGDIIWAQGVAHHFMQQGYKILWPVLPNIVEGLNRAYPEVTFIPHTMVNIDFENKNFYEVDGIRYLPMRFSEHLMGKPYQYHMESKYSYVGLDWMIWKKYAMPVRNVERECELMKMLGISGYSRYCFVATKFGADAKHEINIPAPTSLKLITLDYVDGFSLFDWCSVIENAEIIHAVSSSTLYLFELLDLKAKEIHLYPRKPNETDFRFVQFFFTKRYILHD